MTEVHYSLHPGNIIDPETGEPVFIDIQKLASLYGLRTGEYMVWDDVLNPATINVLTGDRLIHLYPKEDGDYFKIPRDGKSQLKLWADGKSLHMLTGDEGGICCPDFSCCIEYDEPTPKSVRDRFIKATDDKDSIAISSFLSMFMSSALLAEYPNGGVNIIGSKDGKLN